VAGVLDPLHFLFPRVRFSLPNRAEPIFATNSTHRIPRSFGIPKIIWQTNYTDRMDTRERAEFKSSTFGAAQADLWRILVLQKFGGVYLDIDAQWDGRWDSSSSPTTKNSTSGHTTRSATTSGDIRQHREGVVERCCRSDWRPAALDAALQQA
jgi:mannosyltransferase OCH1-like enzyme